MEKETLEEAALEWFVVTNKREIIFGLGWIEIFKAGAEWQAERMYSEEYVKFAYEQGARLALISQSELALHKGKFPTPNEWFEQFKKK